MSSIQPSQAPDSYDQGRAFWRSLVMEGFLEEANMELERRSFLEGKTLLSVDKLEMQSNLKAQIPLWIIKSLDGLRITKSLVFLVFWLINQLIFPSISPSDPLQYTFSSCKNFMTPCASDPIAPRPEIFLFHHHPLWPAQLSDLLVYFLFPCKVRVRT